MSRFVSPRPQSTKTKLTLRTVKPRNPLVAAGLMRQAGSHSRGDERQQARRELRQQIAADFGDRSP